MSVDTADCQATNELATSNSASSLLLFSVTLRLQPAAVQILTPMACCCILNAANAATTDATAATITALVGQFLFRQSASATNLGENLRPNFQGAPCSSLQSTLTGETQSRQRGLEAKAKTASRL